MYRDRSKTDPENRARQSLLLADLDRALSEIERLIESLAARPEDDSEIAILRARILLVRTALSWLGRDRRRAALAASDEWPPWLGMFDG